MVEWLLAGIMGMIGLLYLSWGLGRTWLVDKSSPIIEGKPLVHLSRLQCIGAGVAMFLLAAVPVVAMRRVLRESLLLLIMAAFTARAVGDFKYAGFSKKVKDSAFAFWDTRLYAPMALLISVLAGYLAIALIFGR